MGQRDQNNWVGRYWRAKGKLWSDPSVGVSDMNNPFVIYPCDSMNVVSVSVYEINLQTLHLSIFQESGGGG